MERKTNAKLIAQNKAINKHWEGVKYWTDVDEDYRKNDDENPYTQYGEY
jgi:hypothetical protein